MLSEYVLLCAPYRFESDYLNPLGKNRIEKELFSAIMPGVNFVTRKLILSGIKNNFGIVDKKSLIKQVNLLENGEYKSPINLDEFISSIKNDKQKSAVNELLEMTKYRYEQGFDDCRIIDVITKAYAGNLIDDDEFKDLFFKHSYRIRDSYESWEQYLSSCILGKLLQTVAYSSTITTSEEFVSDIYSYCIAPTNVFSYASFWTNFELENLGKTLAKFMDIEYQKYESVKEDLDKPSLDLVKSLEDMGFDKNIIDYKRYKYLSEMADYVFWKPLTEANLKWLIVPQKEEQDYLLLPKEFASINSSKYFWENYSKFNDLKEDNIFAFFVGNFSIKAIFTENQIYTFKKKLFSKAVVNPIKWSDVNLTCKIDVIMGVKILLDGKTILEVLYPDFDMIGIGKNDIKSFDSKQEKEFSSKWEAKMNKVLSEIPKRIEEFKANNLK